MPHLGTQQHKDHAKLIHWKLEARELREEKDDLEQQLQRMKERSAQDAREALGELDRRLTALRAELGQVAGHARAVEAEQDQALARIEEQQRQLDHAATLARQEEAKLAREHEEAARLRREVEVLRGQVRRLMAEPVPPVAEAIPEAATLVSATPTTVSRQRKDGAAESAARPPTVPTPGSPKWEQERKRGNVSVNIAVLLMLAMFSVNACWDGVRDWSDGLDYAAGDEPSESDPAYFVKGPFLRPHWDWDLAASEAIETHFVPDGAGDDRDLNGTLELDEGCDAAVDWAVRADGELIAEGVLTRDDSDRKLTESLPRDLADLVVTAHRTDAEDCEATLECVDPGLT
ncbi:hypothetical protein ACPCVO_49155 [Streptomyces umbrinus]|uniref:hypothetical protein n=1 Tax=Streptomyces umbrinus TaxID=67370 RepID=UPI003C2AC6DC